MNIVPKLKFAVMLVAAITIPGLAKYVLTVGDYETLGTAVWIVGYGVGIIAIWSVWIRPLDFTGSAG